MRDATRSPRRVRLFRNNRNEAIRIPVEFELPGKEAMISRAGHRLIIEPLPKEGLAALLDCWEPLDEELPNIDDPPPEPTDILWRRATCWTRTSSAKAARVDDLGTAFAAEIHWHDKNPVSPRCRRQRLLLETRGRSGRVAG